MIDGRLSQFAGALLLGVGFAAIAALGGSGTQYFVIVLMIWSIFALGFDIVFGVLGRLSFGHAAFFGTGGYTFSLLMMNASWPFGLALLAAMVVGGALAAIFAVLAGRTRGVYLGLVTLGLAQLVSIVIEFKLRDLTNGTDGMAGVPRPEFGGIDFYDNGAFAYFVAVIFVLVFWAASILRNSPYGRVLAAIRQNEVRAGQLGYNVGKFAISAFAISGAVSGLAGALLTSLMSFVGPELTRWTTSGDVVIMAALGGRGTLLGPIVGVAVFEWLKDTLSPYTVHWYGLLGAIFIVMTIAAPAGLVGIGNALSARFRKRGST
jgi:branched-chain amino acid transport system permease protein